MNNEQPGDVLLHLKQQAEPLFHERLKKPNFKFKPANEIVLNYPNETLKMFKNLKKKEDLSELLSTKVNKTTVSTFLLISTTLFPVQTYRICAELADKRPELQKEIKSFLRQQKHSPDLIFPRDKKRAATHRIVPLIESASITIYNQSKLNPPTLTYRKLGELAWQYDANLYWEPIRGAFSGSLINLDANSDYQIEVSFEGSRSKSSFNFRTRANAPPVDPDKIYYLKDIYTDGQLNLTALNIHGKEGAWAKIVGDDNIVISAQDMSAIEIGAQSYIFFQNIIVRGGKPHAITSSKAHHLWFDGCNVSGWGRKARSVRGGLSYEFETSKRPINHDAGFNLEQSGVVVIENCEVHSPRSKSNSWKFGHPQGPTAFLANADHPNEQFEGQIILRNNRFYGEDEHRFNDVIESRYNGRVWGGFVRDSAIYNNYLAFANDDIIEIDGGQSNVLVYENNITQGFCGISGTPNMHGPSFLFKNLVTGLGDQRGKSWAAFKFGGLFSRPAGTTLMWGNKTDQKTLIGHAFFDSSFQHSSINIVK